MQRTWCGSFNSVMKTPKSQAAPRLSSYSQNSACYPEGSGSLIIINSSTNELKAAMRNTRHTALWVDFGNRHIIWKGRNYNFMSWALCRHYTFNLNSPVQWELSALLLKRGNCRSEWLGDTGPKISDKKKGDGCRGEDTQMCFWPVHRVPSERKNEKRKARTSAEFESRLFHLLTGISKS